MYYNSIVAKKEIAIEYLRRKGITVTDKGKILSELPKGEECITLIIDLEDTTLDEGEEFCYTIIGDQITKIDI